MIESYCPYVVRGDAPGCGDEERGQVVAEAETCDGAMNAIGTLASEGYISLRLMFEPSLLKAMLAV